MTEVIVAVAILVPVCISVFALYNWLKDQETLLHSRMILSYFSNYIWETVRCNDIPTNYNDGTSIFYVNKKDNWVVEFNKNPIYYQSSWGFSKDIESSSLFFQEINYVNKDVINNINYFHYKIKTEYNGYINTFYITK